MSDLLTTTTSDAAYTIWQNASVYGGRIGNTNVAFRRYKAPAGYYLIGDSAQGDWYEPRTPMIAVKDADNGGIPSIAPPVDLRKIWDDTNSGAVYDLSLWTILPPIGYVSLGCVANAQKDVPPDIQQYRCVRIDLVEQCPVAECIFTSYDNLSTLPIEIWGMYTPPNGVNLGTFYAQANFYKPNEYAWQLKQPTSETSEEINHEITRKKH